MSGDYPTKIEDLAKDRDGKPLVCSGCAHSAASVAFPGCPSGERPCCFCVRNVHREQWIDDARQRYGAGFDSEEFKSQSPWHGRWYNGAAAVSTPMDCYHSVDMKRQFDAWAEQRGGQ